MRLLSQDTFGVRGNSAGTQTQGTSYVLACKSQFRWMSIIATHCGASCVHIGSQFVATFPYIVLNPMAFAGGSLNAAKGKGKE